MVKRLQIITLIFGFAGSVMGLYMLFYLQPGRDGDGGAITVRAPCLDSIGEPTC